MLAGIKATNWFPEWAGSARFHDFVSDARDWCISRQRYWGIPIPVWQCQDCHQEQVFGTIAELNEAAQSDLTDPHRPYVDEITIPCSCGGTMKRVEDIFDVWFDSAMASWATLGFPGDTAEFDRLWPADFITEGQDQTRGWFYSQLGASTIAFNRSPYRNVLMHGFALDAEGRKMSKSLGNVVSPEEVVEKFGVDVLRLYVLSANAPWEDLKFNWESVSTVNRTINILWNVYRFPLPYMILDDFSPSESGGVWNTDFIARSLREMPDEDRWIISRVNSVARLVTADMNEFNLHRLTRALLSFILEDLSRWYVQVVRPRMWQEEDSVDKKYAYETIYYCLRTLCQLLAPFAPHIAEEMYGNLRLNGDLPSVHMLPWSAGEERLMDPGLERRMDIIRSFDEAVANARQNGKRKLRWPVGTVTVAAANQDVGDAFSAMYELACQRANAREIVVISGPYDRILWKAEPIMKMIGPSFGKRGPVVKGLIESADGTEMRRAIAETGEYLLKSPDGDISITSSHVTFTEVMPENIFSADMTDATVFVDVTLTADLMAEGYARELIRRIQEMRKQMNLNVEEMICIDAIIGDSRLFSLMTPSWTDLICREVRAAELAIHPDGTGRDSTKLWQLDRDWDIEGITVTIGISVANSG